MEEPSVARSVCCHAEGRGFESLLSASSAAKGFCFLERARPRPTNRTMMNVRMNSGRQADDRSPQRACPEPRPSASRCRKGARRSEAWCSDSSGRVPRPASGLKASTRRSAGSRTCASGCAMTALGRRAAVIRCVRSPGRLTADLGRRPSGDRTRKSSARYDEGRDRRLGALASCGMRTHATRGRWSS